MKAILKGILATGLLITFFWCFRWHTPDMTIVYPDNCTFVIDQQFSKLMQFEIKAFIDAAYKKNKSPSGLLLKIESHFPAIKSIVIDMQNPESLNFAILTYEPIFLVNDQQVVCQFGKILEKSVFSQDCLKKLENISFQGVVTPKNVDCLINFFEMLTDSILKEFSIRWIDKHAIWLDQKQGQDLALLVGYTYPITMQDIAQCRTIRSQISDKPCKDKKGKPCKHNMTWVCDLRFDRQIVLFSTNKGV